MELKKKKVYKLIREELKKLSSELNFSCEGCKSNCCEGPPEDLPLLKEDFKLLKENNCDLSGINVKFENEKYQFARLRRGPENLCYYFDMRSKRCKIHNYKPIICLSFPFTCDLSKIELKLFLNYACEWVRAKEKFGEQIVQNEIVKRIDSLIELYHKT